VRHDPLVTPRGPFDLRFQNRFFNGWPTLPERPDTIVMAFPVEGWQGSAAVLVRQEEGQAEVEVDVRAPDALAGTAQAQALAALSLDVDGSTWPAIGERNEFLGGLQREHRFLRPSMFHSPYEAAAAFVIGHRISIVQTRRIRQRMAEESGERFELGGASFSAFPDPETLLRIDAVPGVAPAKIERLHGVARAALDGLLDRDRLRSLPPEQALAELRTVPGIGPFFAQGILYRAVGVPTGITTDDLSLLAVQRALDLPEAPSPAEAERLTEQWQPLRMWVMVLMHVHLRERGERPEGVRQR
jgi:DNA-3-methyladenine glycosylase II